MKKILLLFLLLPLAVYSQGIHFENKLSWAQVLTKAKAEHKFIFLDCYASWCGPCKLMDREVYTEPAVGAAINKGFIACKLQLDRMAADAPEIKARYADAAVIGKTYAVQAYPTFLFFDPEGRLVHRGLGYQAQAQFIRLATDALNPQRQYYTLLARYQAGNDDPAGRRQLARQAAEVGDDQNAALIATGEIHKLLKADSLQLYTQDNIRFIADFTSSSADPGFNWFATKGGPIDVAMQQTHYARELLDKIIAKENTDSAAIAQKYGPVTADRLATKAKIYAAYGNDWPVFTAALVHYTDAYENPDDSALLHKNATMILQHSSKKTELVRALAWINHSLSVDASNAVYQKTKQAIENQLKK